MANPFSRELDMSRHTAALTEAFHLFRAEFTDPDTGVVYDAPMRQGEIWPTPAEVAAAIPTLNGWGTAIENAPAQGGLLLGGLAWNAFDLAPELRRAALDLIFKGLVSLWEVPGRTGFICRGYLRGSNAFYIQTSIDQVPTCLFGLWMYARSPLCTPQHRQQIAAIFDSVLRWMRGHNWSIRLYDGRRAVHGDILALQDPAIARYLALLLMAHDTTGDAQWREVFLDWREAEARKRFQFIATREKIWQPYTCLYQCFSLRVLEWLDPECASFYQDERRLFAFHINPFCVSRFASASRPSGKGAKTIHVSPDRLIDWRPAYAAAQADPDAGDPEKPAFWYNYRQRLDAMRAEQGVLGDGALTFDFFSILGVYALCQGHPKTWIYVDPARALNVFFDRLSTAQPIPCLPQLAFALGLRNWLASD